MDADRIKEQYQRAMDRAAERLALLEALPAEDPYEDGQVLRISRTFGSSKVYVYTVVRIEGAWWLSGRQYVRYGTDKHERMYSQPVSWVELRHWLVDSGDPHQLSVEEMIHHQRVV